MIYILLVLTVIGFTSCASHPFVVECSMDAKDCKCECITTDDRPPEIRIR